MRALLHPEPPPSPRDRALVLLALLAPLALSCGRPPAPPSPPGPGPYAFPPGFQWSVSASAEESEGRNLTNDWHVFDQLGKAPPAGWAQDAYDYYDTDFANAQAMQLNAFQMTIEWARLFPRPPKDPSKPLRSDADPIELAHYHAVLDDLVRRGLTPTITVTHYTLPTWVDNPKAFDMTNKVITDSSYGGWTSSKTAIALGGYAGFLATEFGSQVSWWLTEDEPVVDLLAGYMVGSFPPGLTNLDLTSPNLPNGASSITVLRNMIAGHALAYRAIHAVQPKAMVSFAKNSLWLVPVDPTNADDVAATARVDHLYNLLFLDALTTGQFDTGLVGTGPMEAHPEWAGSLDFIGVNYYDTNYVIPQPGLLAPLDALPCNSNFSATLLQALGCPAGSPSDISGMAPIALEYWNRYHLPLYVTENGHIELPEAKARDLVQTLVQLHDAMAQGAKVLGYSYWTLNYDYEWNDGYTQNMGIYTIAGFGGLLVPGADGGLPTLSDGGVWAPGPDTDFTRLPLHPIVDVYGEIASQNAIAPTLVQIYHPTDGGS
ncbi:MAG: family 1 glycosylhydrolase [Deltaproteobacteria bacterium]